MNGWFLPDWRVEVDGDSLLGVLAHAGGIDEIAMFLFPALAAIFALRWVDQRVRKRDSDTEDDDSSDSEDD